LNKAQWLWMKASVALFAAAAAAMRQERTADPPPAKLPTQPR
jgi:hypothetical protein